MIYRFKEGELATTFLWNLNSSSLWLPRRLSCQISANQHEAETSANANKHEEAVRVRTDKANFGLSQIALIFPVEDNYPIP